MATYGAWAGPRVLVYEMGLLRSPPCRAGLMDEVLFSYALASAAEGQGVFVPMTGPGGPGGRGLLAGHLRAVGRLGCGLPHAGSPHCLLSCYCIPVCNWLGVEDGLAPSEEEPVPGAWETAMPSSPLTQEHPARVAKEQLFQNSAKQAQIKCWAKFK